MPKIYCMSDIHGHYHEFCKALEFILPNFGDCDRLILLGDYIDYGENSHEVIKKAMELQKCFPDRVIALRGNHEQMLIDYLSGEFSILETGAETWRTFLNGSELEKAKVFEEKRNFYALGNYVRERINQNYADIVNWLKSLPYYYETETQIFVHAGVDEDEGELWDIYPDQSFFLEKFPATTGKFYKTVIAGHIGTYSISGNSDFHGIFHDRKSHFYCDGTVNQSGAIPVLAYDTETGEYSSPNSEVLSK